MSSFTYATRAVAVAAAALLMVGHVAAKTGPLQPSLRSVKSGTSGVLTPTTSPPQRLADTVFNVAGTSSWEEIGSAANTVVNLQIGANAEVTGIGWDVIVSAFDPSWLSELVVSVENSAQTNGLFLAVGSGDDFSGLSAAYSSGGVIDLTGLNLNFNVGADGVLRLEFFEDYDDPEVAPDGLWNSGELTIQVAAAIPEPATYGLMALGLFAVLGAARRRVG